MSVAKVIEISSTSQQSFEDAIKRGIQRASSSLRGVQSAWVKEQTVSVDNGQISSYRVNLMITFIMDEADDVGRGS